MKSDPRLSSMDEAQDEVYGLLYVLDEEDEEALDVSEGVPECYVKMMLGVEILGRIGGAEDVGEEGEEGEEGKAIEVLVYVDVARTGVGVCKEE